MEFCAQGRVRVGSAVTRIPDNTILMLLFLENCISAHCLLSALDSYNRICSLIVLSFEAQN